MYIKMNLFLIMIFYQGFVLGMEGMGDGEKQIPNSFISTVTEADLTNKLNRIELLGTGAENQILALQRMLRQVLAENKRVTVENSQLDTTLSATLDNLLKRCKKLVDLTAEHHVLKEKLEKRRSGS